MHALVGALVLFLLGLLGARFSFTTAGSPVGPRFLFIAGSHFLLVGIVLGSDLVGVLTPAVLRALYPLLALCVGWIGLLFGMQLDVRQLKVFPRPLLLLALLQAVVAFLVFAAVAAGVFRLFGPLDRTVQAGIAGAAATACISSPLGVALVSRLTGAEGRLPELLLLVASLDALVGIVAIQLTFALYHPLQFGPSLFQRAGPEWVALAVAVGLAFGIFFLWLIRPRPTRDELAVFLLGLALFAAGTALYLGVSALFVAVTAGVVIANLSPFQPRMYAVLHEWEKPVYVMLLVLMGAMLDLTSWLTLVLAAGYTALRLLAKLAGGWTARRMLPAAERPPAHFGLALTPQSGMTVVLALSLGLSYGSWTTDEPSPMRMLVSTIVVAVILSELIGPLLTRHVLRRGNAIHSAPVPEPSHA